MEQRTLPSLTTGLRERGDQYDVRPFIVFLGDTANVGTKYLRLRLRDKQLALPRDEPVNLHDLSELTKTPLLDNSVLHRGLEVDLTHLLGGSTLAGALYPGSIFSVIYANAVLLCFDASREVVGPTPLASLHKLRAQAILQSSREVARLVYFVGCKVDLNPALLYKPWEDARNILVVLKPCFDHESVFALLPAELIYQIVFTFIEVREQSFSPKLLRRKDLASLDVYGRPILLVSAKENIGVKELRDTLLDGIFEIYNVSATTLVGFV